MLLRATIAALLLCAALPLLADITTNNDESCDVSVTPAATLLLPYFEVDTAAPLGTGTTTLFTVTNVSRYPQIAHVTVWTDWGYPVLGFNLFLTGYDVQGINLWDVIVRGVVVPGTPPGTSIDTKPGQGRAAPLTNTSNPNFVLSGPSDVRVSCNQLPGVLPSDLTLAVENALATGKGYASPSGNCGTSSIGFNHGARAVGYITIDVVSYCTTQLPTDADGSYFSGPNAAVLFDNVLSGDYQVIGPTPSPGQAGAGENFDAEGGPMVHIHAMPEGGLSGAGGGIPVSTPLPFTFYDRYTPFAVRTADRRQPLPSTWSVRFIQGGPWGFATDLKIWREGMTTGLPNCQTSVQFNSAINIAEIIRFDEHENSFGQSSFFASIAPSAAGPSPNEFAPTFYSLPATSRAASSAFVFPPLGSTDVGGWFYLNLSSGAQHVQNIQMVTDCTLSAQRAGFNKSNCTGAPGTSGSRSMTQNWVIASMFGAVGPHRLSVDFDGLALGNGCTPEPASGTNIAPATQRNGLVCPKNTPATNCAPGTVAPPLNP
jgi:hypothetical protein